MQVKERFTFATLLHSGTIPAVAATVFLPTLYLHQHAIPVETLRLLF